MRVEPSRRAGLLSVELPIEPASAAGARRAIAACGLPEPQRSEIMLIVSELVTNAVSHGASTGCITLSVDLTASEIRIRVENPTGIGRPERLSDDPDRRNGRGLAIVEALSQSWGHQTKNGTTRVWCHVSKQPV